MSVTLFSLTLILIILWSFSKGKNFKQLFRILLAITITTTLNVKMGYFFKIGTKILSYPSFLVYLLAICAIIILIDKKIRCERSTIFLFFILLIIFFIGYISLIVSPYQEKVITGGWTQYILGQATLSNITASSVQVGYYLMLISIGLILVIIRFVLNSDDIFWIIKKVIKYSKISIVIGLIEFITRNIFHSKLVTEICIFFFGNSGAQQNLLVKRGYLFAVQGATKEPSMFNTTLFYLSLLIIINLYRRYNKSDVIWLWLAIILLVLNPTMSAYVYLIILWIVVLSIGFFNKNRRKKNGLDLKFIAVITILICLIVAIWNSYDIFLNSNNYIFNRIGVAVKELKNILVNSNRGSYNSEAIRFTGIIYDIKLFLKRPLFGVGLGAVSCNSGIITFLANAGILGVGIWFAMIDRFCIISKTTIKEHIFLLEILLLPNIILNDYETIFCLIIPLISISYGLSLKWQQENAKRGLNEL